jgi:hypothetical protein
MDKGFYENWFLEYPNGFTEEMIFYRASDGEHTSMDIDHLVFRDTYPVTKGWPMSACGEARWCYNSSGERDKLHQERPSSIVE